MRGIIGQGGRGGLYEGESLDKEEEEGYRRGNHWIRRKRRVT